MSKIYAIMVTFADLTSAVSTEGFGKLDDAKAYIKERTNRPSVTEHSDGWAGIFDDGQNGQVTYQIREIWVKEGE